MFGPRGVLGRGGSGFLRSGVGGVLLSRWLRQVSPLRGANPPENLCSLIWETTQLRLKDTVPSSIGVSLATAVREETPTPAR